MRVAVFSIGGAWPTGICKQTRLSERFNLLKQVKYLTHALAAPRRDRKGFNVSDVRLKRVPGQQAQGRDLPGPGSYQDAGAFTHHMTASTSKKGSGSFASSSSRRAFPREEAVRYTGPGPGDYKARPHLETVYDKYFNKATTTAGFAKVGGMPWPPSNCGPQPQCVAQLMRQILVLSLCELCIRYGRPSILNVRLLICAHKAIRLTRPHATSPLCAAPGTALTLA